MKPPGLGLDTKLEGARSPSRGPGCAKMLATLCVASSLVVVALGGSGPPMGVTYEP
jgi:hypothetical protein